MHGAIPRVWMRWLFLTSILLSGCAPPLVSRLVTVKLVKAPEVDIQEIKTIGVLPFKSPEQTVGRQLAAEIVKGLNREPFLARIIRPSKDFQPESDSLKKLGKKAQVDGLLLGELTEYSIQATTESLPMLALPELGDGDSPEFGWVSILENPTIADAFYKRLKPLQDPKTVRVLTTKVAYALTVCLRLISVESGKTIWREEIARHIERRDLGAHQVETENEVRRILGSMVMEVVSRLRPQESTAKRMLRAPLLTMDPKVAKVFHQGIQAAARDDWKRAEKLFLQGTKLAPNECLIHGNLGVVYEKSGRFLAAVAAYERARKCQPQDPTYRNYINDLQTAFAPDLSKKDLPTLVLGVRGDGIIYLDGGKDQRHHPGDTFFVYRTRVWRENKTARIKAVVEIEFARGEIIEVSRRMSLGRLLLFDPEREVQRGDMVRFYDR